MAGRARLVVTGIQDQWLTGEPQFSYFVMQYRRHSRFAIEAVERPFDGQVGFGQTVTCRIPDNVGDLLRSVTLKVTLGPAALYNTSIGTRIIEHADLLIGGQTVERLTGTYVYMYDQLHNNKDDTEETLFYTTGHGATSTPRTLYVTLPFYFFRHASLAVPICAITKQLVEVRITFKSAEADIAYDVQVVEDPIDDQIIQLADEVAVTVVNLGYGNLYQFNGVYDANKKFGMDLGTYTFTGVPFEHAIRFVFDPPEAGTMILDDISGSRVGLGGHTYYYGTVGVNVSAPFTTGSYGCYIHGAMGGENNLVFSPVTTSSVLTPFTGATISAASIVADFFFITEDEKNFMRTRPMEYIITQVQLANVPVLPDETTRSALLTFQHPVKELMFVTDDFRPIRRIALAFNGEEVFDRSGTYLAYEQSLRHHTGCPSPTFEFYTYSFALEPEVYFPTGQVNMSRIIHKQLTVDVDGPTVVSVYAINYNVLRVESGLAGLKF